MEQNYTRNIEQEEEIKLADYFRIIKQYKWLIILAFIVVMIATVFYTIRSPKIYKASCRIIIEDLKNNEMMFLEPTISKNSINNNMEILKSRPVMNIAFNLIQQQESAENLPLFESENPTGVLKSKIQVESKRETDILTIGYESTSPVEAKLASNAAAEALIKQNKNFARLELTKTREFLGEQLDQISVRLRKSEEDLRLFKLQEGISLLSEETKKLIEKSSDLEARLQDAQTEMEIKREHLNFLQGERGKQDSLLLNVNSVLTSPLLDELRKQIVEMESRYTSLLTKKNYNEDHPELVELKKEIDKTKSKLNSTIRNVLKVKEGSSDPLNYRSDLIEQIATARIEYNVASSRVEGLKKAVEDYERRIKLLPDTELALARLERNYQINEKIHSMLVEKYEDAKIAEQAKMGNVRMVEEAIIPKSPIKPKKMMNLMIGIVLGLGLGIGLAVLLHSLDTKIRTLDDMENYVNLPILGTIPQIKGADYNIDDINRQIKKTQGKEKEELEDEKQLVLSKLITHYSPKSPISEAYRTLRTNLIARRKNTEPMSLLITSSGPKEGKSTTASNLGITLAQMEARVLIIDLDLRRPMVHNIFGLEKENGVSDIIEDESMNIDNIIKKTKIENLNVITSGIIPPNPAEIIASDKVDKLLKLLKNKFDYILIDSPPIIAVTDAMILSKKVDHLLVVVSINVTDKDIIKRTKELLNNVDVKITGVVANGVEVQKYYRGYSYYYYYYYHYYDDSKKKNKQKS